MSQAAGKSGHADRLMRQIDRLVEEGCCPPGDMVVFPVSPDSASLTELARAPGVVLERIGPDVVRVRRVG